MKKSRSRSSGIEEQIFWIQWILWVASALSIWKKGLEKLTIVVWRKFLMRPFKLELGRTSKNSRQHDVIDFYGFNQSAFVENRKGQRKLKSFLKRSWKQEWFDIFGNYSHLSNKRGVPLLQHFPSPRWFYY